MVSTNSQAQPFSAVRLPLGPLPKETSNGGAASAWSTQRGPRRGAEVGVPLRWSPEASPKIASLGHTSGGGIPDRRGRPDPPTRGRCRSAGPRKTLEWRSPSRPPQSDASRLLDPRSTSRLHVEPTRRADGRTGITKDRGMHGPGLVNQLVDRVNRSRRLDGELTGELHNRNGLTLNKTMRRKK